MAFRIPIRGNKFNAKRCEYNGRVYHSKAEALYAMELDVRVAAQDIVSWKPQVSIPLVVNGVKVTTAIIDFEVTHLDGSLEHVEVKGYHTPAYRMQAKLLKALYPDLRYTVIQA